MNWSYILFSIVLYQEMDRTKLGSLERDMQKSLDYAIRACECDIPQSCANAAR